MRIFHGYVSLPEGIFNDPTGSSYPSAHGAPDLDIGHFPKLPRVRVRLAAGVDGLWATQSGQHGPELAWVTTEDFK
jgi:hypothetical protein